MATIWAWRHDAGNWAANDPEKTGWSHQIVFNGLPDLIKNMTAVKPSLRGQETKLGIAATATSPPWCRSSRS